MTLCNAKVYEVKGGYFMTQERLTYDVGEVGKLLHISRATSYKMVNTGQLASIRLGRRILIPRIAIQKLLESAEVKQME
jgi:excisionase family DNA binding protein